MTTISLNPSKTNNIEFQLTVQGEGDHTPQVRFVILQLFGESDLSIPCSKLSGDKWRALLPKNVALVEADYKFVVEVVINEYFFEPASGKLAILSDPVVKIEDAVKPKASIVFTANETVEVEDEDLISEDVEPSIDEDILNYAPLEDIDLSGAPIPAIQENNITEPVVTKRGRLFERTEDGKPIIRGVDSIEKKAAKAKREIAAKLLLNNIKKSD